MFFKDVFVVQNLSFFGGMILGKSVSLSANGNCSFSLPNLLKILLNECTSHVFLFLIFKNYLIIEVEKMA